MEPIIWLGILAVLLIIEALTTGLTTIWFAGGALVAAVVSNFGAGLLIQMSLFLLVSLVLVLFTRPVAIRYLNKDIKKTNVNSMLGKTAVVTEVIDNLAQTGKVKVNDIDWTARVEEDGIRIPSGAVVTVKSVQGVKLIVEQSAQKNQ